MPRDLVREAEVEADLKPDLSKPTLEAMAYILRHREEWPKGHKWAYTTTLDKTKCGTIGCAMGIAWATWPSAYAQYPRDIFRISKNAQEHIFFSAHNVLNKSMYDVGPEDVATVIDLVLADLLV